MLIQEYVTNTTKNQNRFYSMRISSLIFLLFQGHTSYLDSYHWASRVFKILIHHSFSTIKQKLKHITFKRNSLAKLVRQMKPNDKATQYQCLMITKYLQHLGFDQNLNLSQGWFSPGPPKINLFGSVMLCCYLLWSGDKMASISAS